ncbi:hypothetical protein C8R43DRAFT_1155216 [Mycena crocata]|nr:hypothetical protein C8R43DRAFT_1155216 [Mycena crocata]
MPPAKHPLARSHRHNETEAFSDAMLNTEEDTVYIMRLARVEDASGAMRKFREELLAFKQQIAEESRRKQKEKEAEAAAETIRLQSILIITDPDDLRALPVNKKNSRCLREQLDVRRKLWKDDVLVNTTLKDISKKADMLAAILAADQRYYSAAVSAFDGVFELGSNGPTWLVHRSTIMPQNPLKISSVLLDRPSLLSWVLSGFLPERLDEVVNNEGGADVADTVSAEVAHVHRPQVSVIRDSVLQDGKPGDRQGETEPYAPSLLPVRPCLGESIQRQPGQCGSCNNRQSVEAPRGDN